MAEKIEENASYKAFINNLTRGEEKSMSKPKSEVIKHDEYPAYGIDYWITSKDNKAESYYTYSNSKDRVPGKTIANLCIRSKQFAQYADENNEQYGWIVMDYFFRKSLKPKMFYPDDLAKEAR